MGITSDAIITNKDPFVVAPGQQAPPNRAGQAGADRDGGRVPDAPPQRGCRATFSRVACSPATRVEKIWCAIFWICFGVAMGVMFAVVFPRFVNGAIVPFIALLRRELTEAQIAAVVFTAVAILPFTLIITIIPFIWVAGIVFNFGVALAIVMAGSFCGMSLQYLLARYILHDRVERFLAKEDKKRHGLSVTLRAVELAGPWKVVALLRLGPFPYHMLNYVLGVCPSIKYPVYIICSFICELLPRSLQVFFGRSLQTLADLFRGKVTNPGVAVYNLVVLLIGVTFIIFSVYFSKRMLKRLEEEELQREAAEAAAAAAADDPEAALGKVDGPADQTSSGTAADQMSLPLQVQGKLAAPPALGSDAAGAGDLEVLVDDCTTSSTGSGSRSLIAAGPVLPGSYCSS